MATFLAQVKALTSLDLGASTTPNQDEITQFLRDGVMDVTLKHLSIRPQDKEQFTRISGEVTSNGS